MSSHKEIGLPDTRVKQGTHAAQPQDNPRDAGDSLPVAERDLMPDKTGQTWDWRLAYNHVFLDDDSGQPTFHAYDVNDNCGCEPMWGLGVSTEPPNESSHLCALCMAIVREHPRGRTVRVKGETPTWA